MVAVAADYEWFEEQFSGLAEASCITMIRVLTPRQVLDRLGATERFTSVGLGEAEETNDFPVVAATRIGSWTVLIEPNGFRCSLAEVIRPLSRDTRVVSNYRGISSTPRVQVVDDGEIQLSFGFPEHREGSSPDLFVRAMADAGLGVDDDEFHWDERAATLAFIERITTVRLTPEVLTGSTFLCGYIGPVSTVG